LSADQFVQYLVSGLTQGSIYALVGLGFTMIYAVTRIINFAQGEFVMLGGMLSFVLLDSAGLPLAVSIVLAVLIAALVGAALQFLAIRSAKQASHVSLIIITIGAAVFIRGIAKELWGVDPRPLPPFSGDTSIRFLGAFIHPQALWIIGTTVVVALAVHFFLSYTTVGKALKACSVNSAAAPLVGIDPKMMGLIAFVLAALLGAICGAVTAPLTLTRYDVGITLGLKGFVAASIGGFKSPWATVAGGVLLGVVESFAVAADWGPFTSAYKDAIALVVLVLILLARSRKLAEED